MNRDEALTELSMELSPSSWTHKFGTYPKYGFQFTWIEYHARRAELINKPSWDDAPEWAEWLAQDKRGEWCFYPEKPSQEVGMWINDQPKTGIWVDVHCRGRLPAGHDWRQTLEKRPAFNESRVDTIGQNGNDGSHYLAPENPFIRHIVDTMTENEQSMPAEEKHDYLRCGGSYYSPPHDECPCQSGRSDGSTASYYELPSGATELQDLISYRDLNAQDGEIFRAIYRKGRASHSDALRDAKKVLFYAQAEVERLERYG